MSATCWSAGLRNRLTRMPQGRDRRHGVVAAAGAGSAAAARSQGRADARQCRHAARQAGARRGGRDDSGAGGSEASRRRRCRDRNLSIPINFCRRSGRARSRSRRASMTTRRARLIAPINDARDVHGGDGRARVSRRARRFVPHADCGPCAASAQENARFAD